MSSGKRYFWLKLKEDFFGSKRIKKLRNMAGGDTYLIIYLKLQLKAMKTDGIIKFDHLEDNIVNEIALDLDEKPDDVAATLIYLSHCGLAETSDQESLFFPYAIENVGSETSAAERMRNMRKRNKVTPLLQSSYVEKEIEKEIDIEKDKEEDKEEKSISSSFSNEDTLMQIQQDHNEILNAAENAGFPQNKATFDKIIELYADYGKEIVLNGISACVEQGKTVLSYLRKCCQNIYDKKSNTGTDKRTLDRGLEDWD